MHELVTDVNSSRYRNWLLVELEQRLGKDAEALSEIEQHLQESYQAGLEAGLTPAHADQLAVRQFGPLQQVRPHLPDPRTHKLGQVSLLGVLVVGCGSYLPQFFGGPDVWSMAAFSLAVMIFGACMAGTLPAMRILKTGFSSAAVSLLVFCTLVVKVEAPRATWYENRFEAQALVTQSAQVLEKNIRLFEQLRSGYSEAMSPTYPVDKSVFRAPVSSDWRIGTLTVHYADFADPALARRHWTLVGKEALDTARYAVAEHETRVTAMGNALSGQNWRGRLDDVLLAIAWAMGFNLIALVLAGISFKGRLAYRFARNRRSLGGAYHA